VIAAREARQRPADARLLHVDAHGRLMHVARARWIELLRRRDVVVANDAATMPASVFAVHEPSRSPIEIRLAGRFTLDVADEPRFAAVVFGDGDWRTRTEDRPLPPLLAGGDRVRTSSLTATVERRLGHPRLVELRFHGSAAAFWRGLAADGRPVQYAHLGEPLQLWHVWTPIAGPPVAFEPPSAGFALDWRSIAAMRARGVRFATLTHAAGLSSTGDAALDARLPLDEPYAIPIATALAIRRAREAGGHVVAVGTTVVRALEHAASRDGVVRAGTGVADARIGAATRLAVVDAIVTGTHEAGTSHHELLRAFTDDETLERIAAELDAHGYRTHEFGDSVLVARAPRASARCPVCLEGRIAAR
jgi:S-adenosylmethionine:tRNA ribosyltransferase-isomerase